MQATVTLTMVDDVKVVVPDSLGLLTPYVLLEQQDWFEDEIKFLRRLLQPGQKVIDIGANYGLYTLSIAKTVGPTGQVWAFEPASGTAGLLAESIALNGYDHVTLEQSALSDTQGSAQLSIHPHSELSALVRDDDSTLASETVRLVTLDDYAEKSGWQDIDFIKMDAEGEEANILKGGAKFLATQSPLIQFEIKADDGPHLDLVQAFAELGYDSYRLVPGLDLLVPQTSEMPVDRFLLNLFACKPDRAAKLASGNWLVNEASEPVSLRKLPRCISKKILSGDEFNWRARLARLPYGRKLADRWTRNTTGNHFRAVEEALALYALSHDASRSGMERFQALECSFRRFEILIGTLSTHPSLAGLMASAFRRLIGRAESTPEQPSLTSLASLSRVAREYGVRSVAIEALVQLYNSIVQDERVNLDEPFLAPGERFDALDPGESIAEWLLMATTEELERLLAFSSFYSGMTARDRLQMLCSSNFAGPEMQRRLELLRRRFGDAALAEQIQESSQ